MNTNIQSSANAYMLMYRRIEKTDPTALGDATMAAMPSDDVVPDYVREEMKRLEGQEITRKKLEEERLNKLIVKVMWEGREHMVTTSRKKTYKEFLIQLWTDLSVFSSPKMIDCTFSPIDVVIAGSACDPLMTQDGQLAQEHDNIPFDRIRLRQYNTYLKVSQDIHDVATKGEHTLLSLNILDYRSVCLECRAPHEEWDEYVQNGVNILVVVYDPTADIFLPPQNIRLRRNSLVLELKETILPLVKYLTVEDIRLMKLTSLGVSDVNKEEFTHDEEELEATCRIYEGTKIFVENKTVFEDFSDSPSVRCFIKSVNTIGVNISTIGSTQFDLKLVLDRRSTFAEFRKRVALEINMEPDAFRIHRHIVKGQELQYAGHETLQQAGIYDSVSLALSAGTPLQPGFSSVGMVLYDNRCGGGVRNLTEMSLEEAIAAYPIPTTILNTTPPSLPLNPVIEVEIEVDFDQMDDIVLATTVATSTTTTTTVSSGAIGIPLEYEDNVVRAEAAWSPCVKVMNNNYWPVSWLGSLEFTAQCFAFICF